MTPTITVEQVAKRYRIGRWHSNLRSLFGAWWHNTREEYHWAVQNINFALNPGESLGIIGPNGAGKTTVLKLLSRVTQPTHGAIRVNGRLSALIELGAGFHPDLTGRENIYLNGAILGMRRREIQKRFDQIIDFAGIGHYLDTPVKRYSSGMYARLGFAIAVHVSPNVFLVDEVLAVGDYAFQQKCYARMDELRHNGTTLIFVSHNMEAVRHVCDKGLVMYRGQNIFQGTASEAVVAYSDAIRQAARAVPQMAPAEEGLAQRAMTFDAEIVRVQLLDLAGNPVSTLKTGGMATVGIDVDFHQAVLHPIFSLTIRTPDGRLVYDTTTRWMNIETPNFSGGEQCRVLFTLQLPLLDGEYELGADVATTTFSHYYDRMERALSFYVESSGRAQGIADLQAAVHFQHLSVDQEGDSAQSVLSAPRADYAVAG